MHFPAFSISRLPKILYGQGRLAEVPTLARRYGQTALLVTGAQSFQTSRHWQPFQTALQACGLRCLHVSVSGEPSPQLVDETVQRFRPEHIDVVIGIGGGSALDAAKAIAGLLPSGDSVMDYLEGVGRNLTYFGHSLQFIAVPTTAGTGSEATKNAVLSEHGPQGFKKSFRDECLVPEYAVIDAELLDSCSPALLAADGMDALTQLLESYVSLKANPLIDALAWSGLEAVDQGFLAACQREAEGLSAMAYASFLSGITLAQVGLGSVHGLASPLGAFFPIPHGVVCGSLVAAATAVNIKALQQRAPDSPALGKYAAVGRLLNRQPTLDDAAAHDALQTLLSHWRTRLGIPGLSEYGIQAADFPHIVANSRGSSMQTNPLVLTDAEITEILSRSL